MKSSLSHPRTKNHVSSASSAATKPKSSSVASGIPKLTVFASGGGVRPKGTTSFAASTSTSFKKTAANTTEKNIRLGEASSASRVIGKRKLVQSSRTKVLNPSAVSKREKSDLESVSSAGVSKRPVPVIPKRVVGSLFGKRTGQGMHRAAVVPVATVPVAACRRRADTAPKAPATMAALSRLEKEKIELEQRVSELVYNAESKNAEVITLRGEIGKLKEQQKSRSETVLLENRSLHAENQLLRERLEEVGFVRSGHLKSSAMLLDAEREMQTLANASSKVKCSSAPPSISGNTLNRASPFSCNGSDEVESDGEVLAVGGAYAPASDVRGSIEWDKQSSSNVSEVSVACLQDRILQMEETHYSTSEELQATLQELSDLQDQLTELQVENERLAEEKTMFFESLCAKVQELEECRSQLDAARHELHVHESRGSGEQRQDTDQQGNGVSGGGGVESNECERLWSLLEAERRKVSELMASVGRETRAVESTVFELEVAHKDRERFEARAATLQEQLNAGQCEVVRLREQLVLQQEECTASKRTVGELEFRLEQALSARDEMNTRARELERTCRSHLDERRDLRKAIAELERRANEESGLAEAARRQLDEAAVRHARDADEWRQFQADLLMAVRVSNDFKMEAQRDSERLAAEARVLIDRVQALESENERLAKIAPALKATTSSALQRSTSTSTSSYDMRQSVKSLIDTIENASKAGVLDVSLSPASVPCSPTAEKPRQQIILRHAESEFYVKPSSVRPSSVDVSSSLQKSQSTTNTVHPSIRSHCQRNSYTEGTSSIFARGNSPTAAAVVDRTPPALKCTGSAMSQTDGCDVSPPVQVGLKPAAVVSPTPVSILTNKSSDVNRRSSYGEPTNDKKDPLTMLARGGGSRRNALLKWCQNRTVGYKGIDITNFSSSWNDGLAFCALVHTYLPSTVPYETLDSKDKRRNFTIAFQAAESVGIPTLLNINDMISMERPNWQSVMAYVTSIYKRFET